MQLSSLGETSLVLRSPAKRSTRIQNASPARRPERAIVRSLQRAGNLAEYQGGVTMSRYRHIAVQVLLPDGPPASSVSLGSVCIVLQRQSGFGFASSRLNGEGLRRNRKRSSL